MPDKQHPDEEFVGLSVKWTPGARKLVLWAVLAAVGGGVVGFWDQIAQVAAILPVLALVGLFAFTVYSSPAYADLSFPQETVFSFTGYDKPREGFLP